MGYRLLVIDNGYGLLVIEKSYGLLKYRNNVISVFRYNENY